ncbi:MAG: serine/threonine protein kinase [Ktedonobacteraceae bacterium]|nr:serine/threonine protein kinase [Ktedonobacteraceae bacterium]
MSRGTHLIGKTLESSVLEKLLGYGGSSAVFLAQQQNPTRKVAVKVFLPRADMNSKMQRDFYRRFLREAEAASKLDHPNILPVYSYGEQSGLPYIVMPYMPGGTLSEYIAKNGALSLAEAQWYLEQLASALDYAHAHGCVHCDVKPANILLDSDDRVMLSDFGIAHVIPSGDDTLPLQKTEALMGTPDYISPEQALGHLVDGRSDVYSLGITLFYLLAKRLPFIADSTIALALLHVHEAPPSLALIRADISPALDRVMHKALAKQPEKRFQTAGAFSAAFAQAIAVPDKLQATTASGKHAAIQAANADPISGAFLPVLVASEPLVEVKPLRSSNFAKPRLAAVASLLLLLLLTAAYVTNLVSGHLVQSRTAGKPNSSVATPYPLHMDHLTDQGKWPRSKTFFYDQAAQRYHILNDSAQNVALALYNSGQFSAFSLTVTMTQLHRSRENADYYGVVFRSNADQSHYYLFEVITREHAEYVFSRFDAGQWHTIASGPAPSLLSGLGRNNTLTINADDNTFTFSLNNQLISKPVTDLTGSPLRSGQVGLYVEDQGAEVAFSHLYILPRN